jgi:hypothetical protein
VNTNNNARIMKEGNKNSALRFLAAIMSKPNENKINTVTTGTTATL